MLSTDIFSQKSSDYAAALLQHELKTISISSVRDETQGMLHKHIKKLQRCNVFCVSGASNESNVLKHHRALLLWSSATENISHENMTGHTAW